MIRLIEWPFSALEEGWSYDSMALPSLLSRTPARPVRLTASLSFYSGPGDLAEESMATAEWRRSQVGTWFGP